MKTLTLRIKRDFFNAILNGSKTVEVREVKPTNVTRHVFFTCDGKDYKRQADIPDNGLPVYVQPVRYDRLLLINGYHTDAPRLTVEVRKARFAIVTDDDGNDITYRYKGKEYVTSVVEYSLGRVLATENIKK